LGLGQFFDDLGLRATGLRTRHARTVAAAVLVTLGGFGAVAFAVAPLAPDAAQLPLRTVSEPALQDDVGSQLEALAAHDLELWRSESMRAADSAQSVFRRLGLVDAEALQYLRRDPAARRVFDGRGERVVRARATASGRLVELVVLAPADAPEQATAHFKRLTVQREGGRLATRVETAPLAAEVRLASGTIRNSLFAATDEARVPDAVAMQLADIFSVDVDFHRELRRGDTFHVVYEALSADGEAVPWNQGAGRVLAAEFVNAGRKHTAVWFAGAGGKGAYFDTHGRSRKRSFLASPLEFSRVTSGFALRMHPLLRRWRAHLGVDYSAPTGTPVRSVGDGTVEYAGWQNGYGNTVHIGHGNDRSTVYAHLARIDVRKGQRIDQGQRVGAVGATGWATGPHLHFEFRVGGVHQDPSRIAKASERVALDPSERGEFTETAGRMQAKLDAAESIGAVRPVFE
jgi:murein DD-endopeptidase MepM/ murein hydrolase activator NlpD